MTRDKHAHIGHVAGLVWHHLERQDRPRSVLDISAAIMVWPWDVLLALGWLSREDKVRVWVDKAALMAELKKQ